ncbi:helix-turn-helix domain-containing protein [Mycolicibacterium sphagni]|uniref:HTH cro/C1-type domain-containing protein n=1 Tax=Mycolicibacterium sphagni TaxID=1786 RepID=A0A255DQL7_9MYCO|nr:helix-turn-helix transcriptional regulator [Mycolicibacterium sphagni]OYN81698.1 hypothetical protein CG716_04885 [Mycolicibacterium sphagni]
MSTQDGESAPRDWAERHAAQVAAEVRRLRQVRGWSAQKVADRCAQLGLPSVTRPVIADLESGRRKWVSTAELIVLARALDTAPLALLYPDPAASEARMLPHLRTTATYALQWFSGLVDDPTTNPVADDAVAYAQNLRRLQIAREIWELKRRELALEFGGPGETIKDRRTWADAVADYKLRIAALDRDYRKLVDIDEGDDG